jgi:hypothetical protein
LYRQIKSEFWTDPKIRGLDLGVKAHFLYLITNPHSHLSGIYYAPLVVQGHEMGISEKQTLEGLKALEKLKLIRWWPALEIVWVRRMLSYQSRSVKVLAAVAKQLNNLHRCPLISEFLQEYQLLAIPYRYPIDTISDAYRKGIDTLTIPDPAPVSLNSSPDPDPKSHLHVNTNGNGKHVEPVTPEELVQGWNDLCAS